MKRYILYFYSILLFTLMMILNPVHLLAQSPNDSDIVVSGLKTSSPSVEENPIISKPVIKNTNKSRVDIAGTRPPDQKPVEGKPLEKRRPYGIDQQPAFPEQTRANAVITGMPYAEEVVVSTLNHPFAMAFMPDGRLLITERRGSLRIVNQAGAMRDTIKGMPHDILYEGDAGLFGIAIDPDFTKNRQIYFTYAQKRNGGSGLVVASATLSSDEFSLKDFRIIYSMNYTRKSTDHYGSRLLFDKGGKLLVSTSDRMPADTGSQAQWLSSPVGKILRLNTDGTPAAGNPVFPDSLKALPEIWATGFNSPQGITINPQSGDLWEDEIAVQGGDEVNIVFPGKNYGWPVIAYGSEFDLQPIGDGITQKKGLEQPVYYWDPSITPSGCTFYSGKLMKEWRNNLFVAALGGQHVARLVIRKNKVVGEERLFMDQNQRIQDIVEGPVGELWVLTDSENGRLIKIYPTPKLKLD